MSIETTDEPLDGIPLSSREIALPFPDPSRLLRDELSPGTILAGDLRVEHRLGTGGFGWVFAARDMKLGRLVAVKVLRDLGSAMDEPSYHERRRRFLEEGRVLARAAGRNIVTIHGVGEWVPPNQQGCWPYLVMEHVTGSSLAEQPRLPPEGVLHVVEQIVAGVASLHGNGIVHRDLKPSNIMLTADGQVKIVDFGLAVALRAWTAGEGPTQPAGQIAGTLEYMSPEQVRGLASNPRSDLWAIGAITHELMTGTPPFGRPESRWDPQLKARIESADPPDLDATVAGRWLRGLAAIVKRLLAKRPEDRFESAEELGSALRRLRSAAVATPRDPYRFLAPFHEEDADQFFGREEFVRRLALQLERTGRLVIAGPSGAGKTSLVLAGLVPELRRVRPLEVIHFQPGAAPVERLANRLRIDVDAETLRATPGLAGELLAKRARSNGCRVLLFVDAFEEVATEASAPEADAFARAVAGISAVGGEDVRVVLATRDEYLGRFPRLSRAFEPLLRSAEFLGPLSHEALVSALVKPAERLGWRWQDGLADEVARALGREGSPLPLLQVTAGWVWEHRGSDDGPRVLSGEQLGKPGEKLWLGGILGDYANEKLRAASWSPTDLELAKKLLPALVGHEGQARVTPLADIVARATAGEIGRAHELLRDLINTHLLTSQRNDAAVECLSLAHATLVEGWALLREALDQGREFNAFVQRLVRDAAAWEASRRDPALLWAPAAERDITRWEQALGQLTSPPVEAFRAAVRRSAGKVRWLRRGFLVLLTMMLVASLAWLTESKVEVASLAKRAERSELGERLMKDAIAHLAVAMRQGETEQEASRFDAALSRATQIYWADPDRHRTSFAWLLIASGDLHMKRRVPWIASEQYEFALDLLESEPDVRAAAAAHNRVGDSLLAAGEDEMALSHFEEARRLTAGLALREPGVQVNRDLAVTHNRIGDVWWARNDGARALPHYETALELSRSVVAADDFNRDLWRDVVLAHNRVAKAYRKLHDLDQALFHLRTGWQLQRWLADSNPSDSEAQYDLSYSENLLGGVHETLASDLTGDAARRENASSLAWFKSALAIRQRLAERNRGTDQRRDVLLSHINVGDALRKLGDLMGARLHFESAQAIVEELLSRPRDGWTSKLEGDQDRIRERLSQKHEEGQAP